MESLFLFQIVFRSFGFKSVQLFKNHPARGGFFMDYNQWSFRFFRVVPHNFDKFRIIFHNQLIW